MYLSQTAKRWKNCGYLMPVQDYKLTTLNYKISVKNIINVKSWLEKGDMRLYSKFRGNITEQVSKQDLLSEYKIITYIQMCYSKAKYPYNFHPHPLQF